jgi:hypothetical protein
LGDWWEILRLCLVKIGCGYGKAFGTERGKEMERALFECAADMKKWSFTEFGMDLIIKAGRDALL